METNIHVQCHRCNRYLHGNLTGYFRGLEQKIGRKALDELDALPRDKKWTREELLELKEYYKLKLVYLRSGVPPLPSKPTMVELFFPNA